MVTENINIDVRPGGIPIVIHVTQYEVGLRQFIFTPYTSNGTQTVVAGSATLEGTKPDGYAFQQACEMVDGVITYTLQEQLCAVEGRVWSRLVIRDTDGGMIGYTAIVWVVGRAGVKDDAVMSDSDISALQQFLDQFGTIDAYRGALNGALAAVGGPLVAATASAMTDRTKVYVYTGSETGYTSGHWYYWNGSAWTDGGVYQSTGINTDKTLTVEDMAADAKATGDALNSILENQYIPVYTGNVSGTRQVNVTGLAIPAGTYTFFVDSVTSSDTDDTTCRVIFVKNNSTVANVYAQRTTNYSATVTLNSDADEIRFFAANSYNNGTGDTFSFTGISIYDSNTNLRNELLASIKYKGRSNDVGLTDANNAINGSVYNIANGVAISNLPSFNTEGVLITTGGTYPVQLFFVDGIFYKRYLRGSSWTEWKTETAESSVFKFMGRSNAVGLTDANNAGKNTVYNTAGTVAMANLPYSTNEGVLITTGGDFPVQLYFVNDGFYKRYYRGATNGWSAWVNTGVEIETSPSNLIENIKLYNGTGVTLRLSNETFDIISIYKAYYGDDWFDNYTGWNGNPDPFSRGLYTTGIKLKGRANTKFVMSADTGNTAVKTHFSIFAPYTDTTLEDFTIDIGNGYCRYCIHDDFAPQNCKMLYRNLVMVGSSYNADALYGMGCGSNVIYEFDKCWMMSGTSRAWYGHSAPNQTKPCIVKINNCTSYQNIGFKWYSNYSGMNTGYVDKSVQDVTCDAYYDAQTVNFNVYHDTGSTIELLPTA